MLPSADEKVDDPKSNWPAPPPAPANVSDDDAEASKEEVDAEGNDDAVYGYADNDMAEKGLPAANPDLKPEK